MYMVRTSRGFGDVTAGQTNAAAGGIANIISLATSGAPLSTQIEGSIGSALISAAAFAGPAAPFFLIGGAIAGMLAKFGVGSGCGQSCVLSSEYANQAEALLQQNIAAYFNIPAPRPLSAQTAALANFNTMWNDLTTQCSAPSLGSAGKACISDRQAGACTWKQTAAALPPWGTPPVGACWNWWSGYHDPIANDPAVPDAVLSAASTSAVTAAPSSTVTSDVASVESSPYLIPGLIAAGVLLFLVTK
jgi:hypothetical protein